METCQRVLLFVTCLTILIGALLPPASWLLGLIVLIIAFDAGFSMYTLLHDGRIRGKLIVLNLLQLPLFALLHYLVFSCIDHSNYFAPVTPCWYDWLGLVIVYAAKAVDIFDFLEYFGFYGLNVWNNSALSGTILLVMNVMIDVFLIGSILSIVHQKQRIPAPPKNQLTFFIGLKRIRILCFLGSATVFFFLFMGYFMRDAFSADISNIFTWPLDNFLRILDFGDAFQIFDWQLFTMPLTVKLVIVGYFFRGSVGGYILEWISLLYLWAFKGRGKTSEALAEIFISSEYTPIERLVAAGALERFSDKLIDVLPTVSQVLTEKHQEISDAAIRVVAAIGTPAIDHLVPLLVHPDVKVTQHVRQALEKITPNWPKTAHAQEAVPALIKGLIEPNYHARQVALDTLRVIDSHWMESKAAQKAIPFFINALLHADFAVRTAAVEALAEMGPLGHLALFRLVKATIDPNGHVRSAALKALAKIDPDWSQRETTLNAIHYLVEGLCQSNTDVKEASLNMLKRIGAPTFPFIKKMISDKKGVSDEILELVQQINPQGT